MKLSQIDNFGFFTLFFLLLIGGCLAMSCSTASIEPRPDTSNMRTIALPCDCDGDGDNETTCYYPASQQGGMSCWQCCADAHPGGDGDNRLPAGCDCDNDGYPEQAYCPEFPGDCEKACEYAASQKAMQAGKE